MSPEPVFLPVGRDAVLIDLGDRRRAAAAYRLVLRTIERTRTAGVRDVVPAATTVLLDGVSDVDAWRQVLSGAAVDAAAADLDDRSPADPLVIPTRYDGQDLDVVAEAWQCSPAEVVERHVAVEFTVAFCGFAPGFAYCTSEPPLPSVARRADPRPRVPAGSVAVAADYCGVYPREMPGGWQLIGTTDAVLFDPRRDPPALLVPGTRVRFEPR